MSPTPRPLVPARREAHRSNPAARVERGTGGRKAIRGREAI